MKRHRYSHLFLAKDTESFVQNEQELFSSACLSKQNTSRISSIVSAKHHNQKKKVVYLVTPLPQRYRFTRVLFSHYL